ncbi:hypothetical protein [Micromonospora sp. RP3T]|uniref:hypothetical protein n=1 Tax=Micromonospora sp. RP3T TaxID=2135446 RepID=UPI0013048D54|nr:hypothetical protein [Micromonospora sp. RP3T]
MRSVEAPVAGPGTPAAGGVPTLRAALAGGDRGRVAGSLAVAVLLPLAAWIVDRALWLGRRRGVRSRD